MTTAKKLALAAVFLCIVGIAAYKALRESSGSDTRNGRAPGQHAAQPPTVLAVLPSNEEQLLREYEKLAGEFAVLADQVQEERVNFLKGAIGRVLGLIKKPSPIYSNVVESEIPKRFELLSNILKYKDLIRLYVTLFRALDRSDRKLMELEERLRELDQTASAFKLSDVLRRAGFFSAKDELLVFVLESSKEILPQQPKAQIIDSDPCNDPSLPQGLSQIGRAHV